MKTFEFMNPNFFINFDLKWTVSLKLLKNLLASEKLHISIQNYLLNIRTKIIQFNLASMVVLLKQPVDYIN